MKNVVIGLFFIFFFAYVWAGINLPTFAKGKDGANHAVIGNIHEVKQNKVIVEEKKDKKKEETIIDNATKLIGKDKKTLKIKELKAKDIVAVIATDSGKVATDGAKIKKAIKVFVKNATESATLKRRAVHGIISSIDGNILMLVHQIHQDRVFQVVTDTATTVKMKGVQDASLSSLGVGMRIVAVGDISSTGGILARRIHVIPGKAKGVFRRSNVATPSATILPSPTTTPSATLTVTPTSTASGGVLPL